MYFLGMGFYVSAMVDDLTEAISALDKDIRNRSTEQIVRMNSKKVLADEIRFHNEMIEYETVISIIHLLLYFAISFHLISFRSCSLALVFGESMGGVIFYQMLFSAIDLATFMFAIDETKGMNPSNSTAIEGALTVLLPSYLFCQLSENVTERLENIGDVFYGCSWYYLSAEQQQMFLLPIQRAEKKFRLNGLDIVDCSLEIFSRVNSVGKHSKENSA